MESMQWLTPAVLAVFCGLAGFGLGLLAMYLLQKRKGGGKSAEKLREEFETYREDVSEHFATTSELFGDLTEKYRDVYNHLAGSSQKLCEDPMQHARLEFTDRPELTDAAVADQVENNTDANANAEQEPATKVPPL